MVWYLRLPGLIDALAVILEMGLLDHTGLLKQKQSVSVAYRKYRKCAALFANMGNDNNADKVEEPAEETVEPEDIPEPIEEPEAVKEAPLQPEEPADPNKALSPDEIAALFASMGT